MSNVSHTWSIELGLFAFRWHFVSGRELKHLGVNFDAKKNCSEHTGHIARTASQNLFPSRPRKLLLSFEGFIDFFKSITRFLLQSFSLLFIGISANSLRQLERVQRRINDKLCGYHCDLQVESQRGMRSCF